MRLIAAQMTQQGSQGQVCTEQIPALNVQLEEDKTSSAAIPEHPGDPHNNSLQYLQPSDAPMMPANAIIPSAMVALVCHF